MGQKSLGVALVGPVSLGLELLREILHLIRQDPLLGQIVPLVSVGPEGHGKKRHVGLFRRLAIFQPVAAFAGRYHVFPFVAAAAGNGHDVIAGEFTAGELTPAV